MFKKVFFIVAFLLLILSSNKGQNVTTLWPYLYENFQDGQVLYKDGSSVKHKLNVHVLKEKLHFLRGDQILEADVAQVIGVDIMGDSYLCVDGRVMKVVASSNNLVLLHSQKGDFDALFNSGGAYGSSSSSSSIQKLSSIEIGGISNMSHMYLKQNALRGSALALKSEYFFFKDGVLMDANRKSLETLLSEEQRIGFKSFLKTNKIKWSTEQGLKQVLTFWEAIK